MQGLVSFSAPKVGWTDDVVPHSVGSGWAELGTFYLFWAALWVLGRVLGFVSPDQTSRTFPR